MTPQEYLNTVTSQSPTPMAAPNNVADMLVFLASQPVGSVQVDPPPEPNPPAVELMNTINLIVEGLQRLLQAKATYQSITVPLPPQTEKGIMSNETRGDILLNALAYSGETIQQFYDRLLFFKQRINPDLLKNINMVCMNPNITDTWIGVDDQLGLLSYYNTNYGPKDINWGDSKLIP